jgi:hypothetical protein
MEMKQINFKKALEKGAMGEKIIKDFLEEKGWIVYQPFADKAHAFDMLAIKDKKKAIALDIKAKSRLDFIEATGINTKHFETYKLFSEKHNMPFWIIFVDEMQKTIYGNTLDNLEKPVKTKTRSYPSTISNGSIRIWSLLSMKHIADLSEDQCNNLKSFNQRNSAYSQ